MNARVDYSVPLSERLLSNVEYDTNGGCWLWAGSADNAMRGKIMSRSGIQEVAARVAYEVFVGPMPAGHFACHRCDVPSCINPLHLFAGTPLDNIRDMIAKGRRGNPVMPRGADHVSSKIGEPEVVIIRHLRKRFSARRIAKHVSIGASNIDSIMSGRSWGHAPERALTDGEHQEYRRLAALIDSRPGRARLTAEQVAEIRRIYVPRHPLFGQPALAARFKVSRPLISMVVTGRVWA